MISPVPVNAINDMWDMIEPHITAALEHDHNGWTAEMLRARAELGMILFLVIYDQNDVLGACAVEVTQRPRLRVLTVLALGGERMAEWEGELEDTLKDIARGQQARAVECHGRRGWVKILGKRGWHEDHVTMRLDV